MAHKEEEISYEFLRNKLQKELRSSSLSKIDPNFWQLVEAHIRAVQDDYVREHGMNPSSPKTMILQDELRTLQRARDDIYDLREKKVIQGALAAARGGNTDPKNMSRGEQELYEELVRVLKEGRRNMLRRGARTPPPEAKQLGEGAPPTPPEPVSGEATPRAARPASTDEPEDEGAPESPLPGMEAAEAEAAPSTPPPEPREAANAGDETGHQKRRAIVHVTERVPPFVASDMRTYRLGGDDIASLPKDAAKALTAHGKARVLEGEV